MSDVINYYTSFAEREWTRLDREPLEFQVNWHFIKKYLPINGEILDNGAGPGKYAMQLAREGYRVTLTDLTPKLVEIAREKAAELNLTSQFRDFYVADARRLSPLQDEQFDATLMLGPFYHLQQEQDRITAAKELHRVTKKDGIVFVAFRSRINHIYASLTAPQNWKPNDKMDAINAFRSTGVFNHSDEGRFTGAYFFNIDEIKPFMEEHGFASIELIGSTNIGAGLSAEQWAYWQSRGDDEYAKLIELLIETAADPSVLGMSSHLLYIGRRV